MNDKEITNTTKSTTEAESESRRDFLKKAGMFALYTPPAITLLMNPSQASIMNSPGGNRRHGNRDNDRKKHHNRHENQGRRHNKRGHDHKRRGHD